jgi:hypothetical protein
LNGKGALQTRKSCAGGFARATRRENHRSDMEAELAHAEDFPDVTSNLELPSETPSHRSRPEDAIGASMAAATGRRPDPHVTEDAGLPDIGTATTSEERVRRLSLRLYEIEEAIRSAEMFLGASEAIEELLLESRCVLEKGKLTLTPSSRKALADCYEKIKKQIDDIVAEAQLEGHNLAAGDSLEISFAEDDSNPFEVGSAGLSVDALGLSGDDIRLESDLEILEAISQIDSAADIVRTRRTVIEMTLTVLESRAKFARKKIHLLRSRADIEFEQDEACRASGDIASRHVGNGRMMEKVRSTAFRGTSASPNSGTFRSRSADDRDDSIVARDVQDTAIPAGSTVRHATWASLSMANDNLDRPIDRDGLDDLAKDLFRVLKHEDYLRLRLQYDAGESEIFTRQLSESYGPELIQKISQKYSDDGNFKEIADRYMVEFEAWIEREIDSVADRKPVIDRLLKTDQGTVYIMFVRASDRI